MECDPGGQVEDVEVEAPLEGQNIGGHEQQPRVGPGDVPAGGVVEAGQDLAEDPRRQVAQGDADLAGGQRARGGAGIGHGQGAGEPA